MKRVLSSLIALTLFILAFAIPAHTEHSWTFYYVQPTAPASCSVGELWFKSGAAAGSNWYGCTAANTWTLQGPSGLTANSTSIASGTNTRCLFDDNGVLGEDAGCTYTKATGIQTLTGGLTLGGAGAAVNLVPSAANRLSLRNGTAAQTLDLYQTFTDASNYGRWVIGVGSKTLTIIDDSAGTGMGGNDTRINLVSGGSSGDIRLLLTGSQTLGLTLATTGSDIHSPLSLDTTVKLVNDSPATLQLGVDAASPIAQTLKGPDGSGTDIAGGNLTLAAGNSTGSGAGGSLILSTTPAGAGGSGVNNPVAAITIASTGIATFAQKPSLPAGTWRSFWGTNTAGTNLGTTGTEYMSATGDSASNVSEYVKQQVIAANVTVKNLYCDLTSLGAPGAGVTRTFTIRDDAASTAVTCAITGAVATTCNDTVNSASVAAGSRMAIMEAVTGGTAAATTAACGFEIDS